MRLLNFETYQGRLPDLFDGVLYIRTATPSNQP